MRSSARKFTTITTAIALAFGATFTLSGCFANPLEDMLKGGAGDIIKGATGADMDFGGTSIPKDFPVQIPVAEGEIEMGGSITVEGNKVWTLRINANDPNVFEKISRQLVSNGFEESFRTEGKTPKGGYDGHGYGLILNVDIHDGKVGVTYVVTETDDE
jgi:hypothetical protein